MSSFLIASTFCVLNASHSFSYHDTDRSLVLALGDWMSSVTSVTNSYVREEIHP